MGWTSLISSVGDVVTAFAIVAGAIVANKGVNAWRRETLGKRKIELAEQAVRLFRRAQEVIRHVRSPFMPGGEVVEVYKAYTRSDDVPTQDQIGNPEVSYFAALHRMEKHRDVFVELDSIRPLFTAYFGDDTETAFERIFEANKKISVAAQMLVQAAQRGDRNHERMIESVQRWESTIWDMGEQDELRQTIESAVDEILTKCRDVLRREQ